MSAHDPLPVFVYGTLRSGEPNERWLTGCRRALAWLEDHVLHARGLPYPYVTPAPGSRVRGEVCWPVDGGHGRLLARLDALEGFVDHEDPRNHYDRVVGTCRLDDGRRVRVWVYVAGPEARARLAAGPDRTVPHGDWRS